MKINNQVKAGLKGGALSFVGLLQFLRAWGIWTSCDSASDDGPPSLLHVLDSGTYE